MDLNVNMTLNLSTHDVAAIIKEYIESKGYALTGNIDFIIRNKTEGYGMMERVIAYFDGANVSVTK